MNGETGGPGGESLSAQIEAAERRLKEAEMLVQAFRDDMRVELRRHAGSRPVTAVTLETVRTVLPRFTLTIAKTGTGSGTVTSSAGGINCGTTCAADFDSGTTVTLSATPAGNSTLAGWSGACSGSGGCTVTIDAAKTVTATFGLAPHKKVFCIVPNVKRTPLATAKRRIVAAHCRTGRVGKAYSKTLRKGRVISQRPKAGKKLVRGSKVNLVVSRGKSS